MEDRAKSAHHEVGAKPYMMLAVNLGLSLLVMYVAMFAMIWSWGEFIQNVNFFYMALVMWAPMGAIMLATMGGMYRNRKLNAALYVAFAAILVLSLVGIRQQSLVGDDQFLRSMIPHHSGAILMCEEAKLTDPEIRQLCGEIIQAQKDEIAQMKRIMGRH
jgi:uncharacterized protein (DUF305 family)